MDQLLLRHPGPGEDMADAVRWRARQELGVETIENLKMALPDFRYRAVDVDGIVETNMPGADSDHGT